MSMSTSLRYEVENPSAKALKKALLRQNQRIKDDEVMTQKEVTVRNETQINLTAQWTEKLEETSFRKKVKRQAGEIQQELFHANTELIAVRRSQLCILLRNEEEQYARELNDAGKTFHTQRS